MGWSTPKTMNVGDPAIASDWNTYVRDNDAFLKGDLNWSAAVLTNSWTNFGGGFNNAGYRKVAGDLVLLRGAVTGGTNGSSAFTLPTGYRPPSFQIQSAQAGSSANASVIVTAAGLVEVFWNTSGTVILDGVIFSTI